jgi:hypothetical protein
MATDVPAWTVADLIAALSRLEASAHVNVFARTGRGDAILTDRFEIRVDHDEAPGHVTITAGWDRNSPSPVSASPID